MNIPQHLKVKHYYKLQDVTELRTASDLIRVVEMIVDDPEVDIRTLKKDKVEEIVNSIMTMFSSAQPKFWSLFEFEGVTYGFQPPSKMTLGEWIDMENHAKDFRNSLHKLMAVCYRPVTKNRIKKLTWKTKYKLKVYTEKDLFKAYEVSDYDYTEVDERSELFKELPVEIALGAMAFFLSLNLKFAETIAISSTSKKVEETKPIIYETQTMIENLFQGTTDGF